MRVFAVSDIHIDYAANAQWVKSLSAADYRDDVLILAGDVTDSLELLDWCLTLLAGRFRKVLFVPGNHDLWVLREKAEKTSMLKLQDVRSIVTSSGVSMRPYYENGLAIVPLMSWYDFSFGEPSEELLSMWMDFHACRWPPGFAVQSVAAHFEGLNDEIVRQQDAADAVITFSHFLPRIDVMPSYIPNDKRRLYPVLGTSRLDGQLRRFGSTTHVYGHSHVNRNVTIEGVRYVNNAFGYPHETRIAAKQLVCIHER